MYPVQFSIHGGLFNEWGSSTYTTHQHLSLKSQLTTFYRTVQIKINQSNKMGRCKQIFDSFITRLKIFETRSILGIPRPFLTIISCFRLFSSFCTQLNSWDEVILTWIGLILNFNNKNYGCGKYGSVQNVISAARMVEKK